MSSSKTPFKQGFRVLIVGAALGSAFALGACGYHPLYAHSRANPQVIGDLNTIYVEPIPDRIGQQMQIALSHKLARRATSQDKAYSLQITLSESIGELAIEKDAFATRANLNLSASYSLVRQADHTVLTAGSISTISSYNLLTSDYATLSAQRSALKNAINNLADDLYTRLATYFQGPGKHQPPLNTVKSVQ